MPEGRDPIEKQELAGGEPAEGEAAEGRKPGPTGERLSDAERQRRIEEAAYRKAEQRGFRGDRQLEDWLEAEREHNEGEGRAD
jgi:hypothetical protein